MPVSAALLVTNVPVSGQPGSGSGVQGMPGSGSGPVRHQQSFARGEKTSSSVRLRKRRDDVTQPGRKINRHSGDFSFFSQSRQDEIVVRSVDPYIAYQDPVKQLPSNPVLVTMREAPGVNQVKLRTNLAASRAVSASVMNIQEQHHHQQLRDFRKSGDFSLFNDPAHNYSETEDVNARRRPHARSHSQQPIKPGNNNLVSVTEQSKMHHQACAAPSTSPQQTQYCHVTPGRPGGQAVRSATKKEDNNVTKRCSGEFEFKRINRRSGADFHQLQQVLAHELDKAEEQSFVERMISRELLGDSGSEGSEESGIFSTGSSHESPRKESRKPGLGRRAITQVNMREKKNSYNHALAKSQENLVKVCRHSRVLFLLGPRLIIISHLGFLSGLLIILGQEAVITGYLLLPG